MQDLDEAFDVLDDPARRAEYDAAREELPATETTETVEADVAEPAPATAPAKRDLTVPIAAGLILSGIAALAVGAFVLVGGLSDDDEGGTDGDFVTTDSGLKYQDIVVGEGATAELQNIASVHYTGRLEDGTEFDSSVGQSPFSFTLGANEVIPGWDEGVAGMKRGGERRLLIPPELAYGSTGAGNGIIPPNATLDFDISLLGVHLVPAETPPEVSGDEIELENGLVAIDIAEGDGDEAATGNTVAVHYTGWLKADGKRFDSSLLPRQGPQGTAPPSPFAFLIGEGNVIRGWDAGVPGMKEGGKRRLIIPAALAYGTEGQEPDIPANADLIFDIELIEVAGQ
jgi:peptidylprolyl isomerase